MRQINQQSTINNQQSVEEAIRNDRLTAMGEMAVKIAHEIRNPLGSIELFATILKKELDDFEELKTLAEHISSGVQSINNIISNLLMFMRPEQMPDFKPVDICNILDDSLFFSRHVIKSNSSIEVIKRYASTSLMMPGDSELLKQMSLNIILNAIQAMPDGGTLRVLCIKVANANDDNDKERNCVEIRFADTGTGISKEDMPKIFDPFFTTKKKGTGLGMSIVNNIINVHGGMIKINSSKSKGTECIVTLPMMECNQI
ncbi:MAG: ATP-binding protein [Thermodesulfobacteriota bacterium]|nr:ATP-binding protein [Thermodesulfobacteriota bacterium]